MNMTDRYHSLVVVLDRDIRIDDAEAIISAIKMIKNVINVTGEVSDMDSNMAYSRVKNELKMKLWEILK